MSNPARPTPKSPMRLAVVATLVVFASAACGVNPQPTDYGDDYENNYMLGCSGYFWDAGAEDPDDRQLDKSKDAVVTTPVAECECMYAGFEGSIPFSEVKEFEDRQAEAETGDDIEIPDNIAKIIDDCRGEPG
ncbi:MAG: hypothetical protein GY812_00460 [Actinomycetia bacterium]|nr:hypothetical protein [Actinomycetes bacterium]